MTVTACFLRPDCPFPIIDPAKNITKDCSACSGRSHCVRAQCHWHFHLNGLEVLEVSLCQSVGKNTLWIICQRTQNNTTKKTIMLNSEKNYSSATEEKCLTI